MSEFITKLTNDIGYVQQLGDYPKVDNNMTSAELKAWFDKAPLEIKQFLNESLIQELEQKFQEIDEWSEQTDEKVENFAAGTGFVDVAGINPMIADFNVNKHRVINVIEPKDDTDAVNLGYADDRYLQKIGDRMAGNLLLATNNPDSPYSAASKGYVDSKHFTVSATLSSFGWSSSAPYTQTVTVAGVLATDYPHVAPVYGSVLVTAQAQQEAWAAVSKAEAAAGSIVFTCFEDKPSVDIPIQVEVNR